ncbi:MAG: heme-binding protein [gamma proteobacterium endosymbiont of Lamellibrachia anaximandri]|nr:heme-binding protein [gamma proteobacterium endosymbiont of Lamellibrachia anaximandri]MBL3619538.1 heme-binding protein [gamma proteobacterium endosymbiont of Lamellibrachia anaximandri]
MKTKTLIVTASLLTVFMSSAIAETDEEDGAVYKFRTLSLELASKAALGAIEDCRKRGYSIAVAVVDRGGNAQAQLRDRFAGPHTSETALRKAWTANSFRQSTADLAGLLEEKRIPSQVPNNPGVLLVGGGLIIQAAGEILGGIGVSGAPPGKSERDSIDGACAQAGIEAIHESLEFSD